MIPKEIKSLCEKLKPIIGAKADTLWLAFSSSETYQEQQRMATLIHLFAARNFSGKVDDTEILLPPPNEDNAAGEFLLGTI